MSTFDTYLRDHWSIGNVPKYRYFLPNYQSENDWSAELWLNQRPEEAEPPTREDYIIYNYNVPEAIYREKEAKDNGTYLQLPDGTPWTGDPRIPSIMQMENFKKNFRPKRYYSGQDTREAILNFLNHSGSKWLSNNRGAGDAYAHIYTWDKDAQTPLGNRFENVLDDNGNWVQNPALYDRGYNFMVAVPKDINSFTPPYMDEIAQQSEFGIGWSAIPYRIDENDELVPDPDGPGMKTDDLWEYAKRKGFNAIDLKRIIDGWASDNDTPLTKEQLDDYYNSSIDVRDAIWPMLDLIGEAPYDEVVVDSTVPIKSIPGNNLNFNLRDRSIYRKKGGKLIPKTNIYATRFS